MSIGRLCSRVVATAGPSESVQTAAARMEEYGVGTLVVVEEGRQPRGIVTDRDIVVRCVAQALDPTGTAISEIMSSPVRSGHEAMPLDEALESMEGLAARRLVVTGDDGELVGILALDDVLGLLVRRATRIGGILEKQGRSVLPAPQTLGS